jgi:hypothetical protein
MWRLFEFPVSGMKPSVRALVVHLPNEHSVKYDPAVTAEQASQSIGHQTSHLLEFFKWNQENDGDFTYQDAPVHLTWFKNTWKERVNDVSQIGRIHLVNPAHGDVFYLRCLLSVARGPKCFEDLRTVRLVTGEVPHPDSPHDIVTRTEVDENGASIEVRYAIYHSFRHACFGRGLFQHDNEWRECFREAITLRTGWELRRMFVSLMLQGEIDKSIASSLWSEFKEEICERLMEEIDHRQIPFDPTLLDPHLDYGLFLIDQDLRSEDRSLATFDLPLYHGNWGLMLSNPLIRQEREYNLQDQATLAASLASRLNHGQRVAYDRILLRIRDDPFNAHFFLHGPGGTGKTFLYQALAAHIRSIGGIVLCVASTGIASLLLPGGRTAHKRFLLPLDPASATSASISRGTQRAALLRETSLIIWDETPMMHREHFDIVDRNLRDLREDMTGGAHPFGGVPVILGGDFQQILPVIRRGNRADTVAACLQYACVWPKLELLPLHQNMRLDSASDENRPLATWLKDMSYKKEYQGTATDLPPGIWKTHSMDRFLDRIYPLSLLRSAPTDPDAFNGRAILTAHNNVVHEMNDILLDRMPGTVETLYAENRAVYDDNSPVPIDQATPELLGSINLSGLPVSDLRLKIGAPVMVIRNIDATNGLCNGTRATVVSFTKRVLRVKLADTNLHDPYRLLYRCTLTSNKDDLPFILRRCQFPIRLAFALTINKAQGQSLRNVAIDLRQQVFCHGQLYVAFSRTTNAQNVSILAADSNTDFKVDNVVYPEVLGAFEPPVVQS